MANSVRGEVSFSPERYDHKLMESMGGRLNDKARNNDKAARDAFRYMPW